MNLLGWKEDAGFYLKTSQRNKVMCLCFGGAHAETPQGHGCWYDCPIHEFSHHMRYVIDGTAEGRVLSE